MNEHHTWLNRRINRVRARYNGHTSQQRGDQRRLESYERTSPRTGQQFSISHGDYTAVIAQLGATLRVFRYQGDDVTVSTGPDDVVTCCVGRVLVPFPNRLEHGSYDFDGAHYQLPVNEPERDNAIHGFGMNYYWQLERLAEDSVTLSWRVPLTEGYPFSLQVFITYTLSDSGMRIDCDAVNNGDGPAPWAMAVHPWFSNGEDAYGDAIDAVTARCSIKIPANTHVLTNENLIPTGTEAVDGTKFDFRTPTLLDQQPYDDALTDLDHDADGTVTAVFTRPDGRRVAIIGDEHHLVGMHRKWLPGGDPPDRRRRGTADRVREHIPHRHRPHRDRSGRHRAYDDSLSGASVTYKPSVNTATL